MNTDLNKQLIYKIVERVQKSVALNFRASGRPVKWDPSGRTRVSKVSKYDKKKRFGKTLINTGTLMRSIHDVMTGEKIEIGTNVSYARIHQYGGSIEKNVNVKAHTRVINQAFGRKLENPLRVNVSSHDRNMNLRIPARPFLMYQKDDLDYIENIMKQIIQINLNNKGNI